MNEIKLSVDDKNLEVVLTLLNNLKDGLITNIQTNTKSFKKRTTQYQPKTNTIIREEDSRTNDSSGKYINPASYRHKIRNKTPKAH